MSTLHNPCQDLFILTELLFIHFQGTLFLLWIEVILLVWLIVLNSFLKQLELHLLLQTETIVLLDQTHRVKFIVGLNKLLIVRGALLVV